MTSLCREQTQPEAWSENIDTGIWISLLRTKKFPDPFAYFRGRSEKNPMRATRCARA
jgi:hypothetical protein